MSATVDADALVRDLAATGVDVRAAGDDAVDGVPAAAVGRPTSTEQTAALLRAAAERELAVVARGTGTKLDWGAPPSRLDLLLDTTALSGVTEHAAGDLVVRAGAGTPLDTVVETVAEARQRLALDPLVDPGAEGHGTVGGVIATGADGPLRHSHGAVRDLLIGVTIVRADGVIAKAGGKVVKNVAGYDLGKLFTGSWGTLGVITEAIFRLHPLPEAARCVVARGPDALRGALEVVHGQLVPAAVEIDYAGGDPTVAVLIEGTAESVPERVSAVEQVLGGAAAASEQPPDWWGRAPWTTGGTALRLTTTQTGTSALLAALRTLPVPLALRGAVGVGKLHAGLDGDADAVAAAVETLRARRSEWGGDVVVLAGPAAVRERVDAWGPVVGLDLMRRVKDEFDPGHRLAPGRFAGGI